MSLQVLRVVGDDLVPVGAIDKQTQQFTYSQDYADSEIAAPLSRSLPLQAQAHGTAATEHYFKGLLPEGLPLERIATQTGVNPERYLDVLEEIGQDCIADVCVTTEDVPYSPAYEAIGLGDVADLLSNPEGSARANAESRLSLAGTQDKIGLAHNPEAPLSEGWFRPYGCAASSHIIKIAPLASSVPYIEYLCMGAAERCGIEVAQTDLVVAAGTPLLVSERYDRDVKSVRGDIRVRRRHQEDLAQAFGVPPAAKYAELNGGSVHSIAQLLYASSSQPIADIAHFAHILLFNYAIGNCDAHLKNFSLLYSEDWRSFHLAPAYDIVCTTRFRKYSRNLAMHIGDATTIDEVTPGSLDALAADLDIAPAALKAHARNIAEHVAPALVETCRAADLDDEVLWYECGNLQDDAAERVEVLLQFAARR